MTLLILAISIKAIIGVILILGLMFLSTQKLFKTGWKGMTNEQRMFSVLALMFLSLALLITGIFVFN